MQHGIVKYDKWEDVLWVYNGLQSHIRTPLNGSLVGINVEDETIKYSHWGYQQQSSFEGVYNELCGCCRISPNAIQPYESALVVSNADCVEIMNKDGGRRMRVTSTNAEMQVTNYGKNHIVCSLLHCTQNHSTAWLGTNGDTVYGLDSNVGAITNTFKVNMSQDGFQDKVTVISDFSGNATRSSCIFSYCQPYATDDATTCDDQFTQGPPNDESNSPKKSSLENIAKRYGSIEAIPEFVPSSAQSLHPVGIFTKTNDKCDVTFGALSLSYAIQSQSDSQSSIERSRDKICVGMLSGLVHVLDTRMQHIAHTIEAQNNAVGNLSAYGTLLVTSGCYLYGDTLIHEPLLEVHDMRLKKSGSLWLGAPIRSTSFVPNTCKVLAMQEDGGFYECDLLNMQHIRYPNISNRDAWKYHDIDVNTSNVKGIYRVFTANEAYTLNTINLEINGQSGHGMNANDITPECRKIDCDRIKYTNNTPYASLIGSFKGDVVQVFVQVFFFLEKLMSIRYHTCEVEHCVTCQIGFAIHMLKIAHENRKGGITDVENKFATTKQPELKVTQLQELMPVDRSETDATSIQRLFLWVIEKINSELEIYYERKQNGIVTSNHEIIKSVFGFSKTVDAMCKNGHKSHKVVDNEFCLTYAQINAGGSYEEEMTSFCTECAKPVETKYTTTFNDSPNFMVINCDLDATYKIKQIKDDESFLGQSYKLTTVVFSVPSEDKNYRLLAYVKLSEQMKDTQEWLLINDGYICEIEDSNQIFDFSAPWKEPIMLIYRKCNMGVIKEINPSADGDVTMINVNGRIVPLPAPNEKIPIPASIFISESNIAHNPRAHDKNRTFVPFSVNELLTIRHKDYIVALDVEGVKTGVETLEGSRYRKLPDAFSSPRTMTMNRESFVYSADETEEQELSTLARVSAVRGCGEAFGIPFLDHYIHRREPPKDYLTRFSGIHQGDLDLKSSLHWLTTRKSIYMKIRYLVDAGCKILGHGLEQDFKMLNIVVPKSQVIDTVELYRLPGRRYISLQFLAAHILNIRIQDGEHDSIEDAKAALYLYRKYLEYKEKGELQDVLASLYDIGYRTNWVVN